MLYVTTRNNQDAFTAQRALRENRGPDGGFYLPLRMPKFPPEELETLMMKPFNQRVAEVLNLLFGTKLSGWDVDFSVGRYPVRLAELRHRIIIAENWHNPEWCYARMERCLSEHIGGSGVEVADWVRIGIRIAVLFGIWGELFRKGIITLEHKVDISIVSGDFSAPIGAWYAKDWGLPIGNIVCCCNENSEIWNLICHGYLRTNVVSVPTSTPLADITLPEDLERLIHGCGSVQEVEQYLEACRRGDVYSPDEQVWAKMKDELFISVVSDQRVKETIPSVYKTHNYLMSPYTSLAYAGLLDYRAKKRKSRHAIVLSDISPICNAGIVADALGVSEKEINNYF